MEEALLMLKSSFESCAEVDQTKSTLTICEMKKLVMKEICEGDPEMMEDPQVDALVKKVDRNKDGKVDLSEFLRFSGWFLLQIAKIGKKLEESSVPSDCSSEPDTFLVKALLLLRGTFESYAETDQSKKTLTKKEMKKLLENELCPMKQGGMSNRSMHCLLKRMDKNKDSVLDLLEFLSFCGSLCRILSSISGLEKSLCLLQATFESYAKNDPTKKSLTNSEMKTFLEKEFLFGDPEMDLKALIAEIDINKDKKVDFPEFLQFCGTFLAMVAECGSKMSECSDSPASSSGCGGALKALGILKETFTKYAVCDETKKTLTKEEMGTLLADELSRRDRGMKINQDMNPLIDELDENKDQKLDFSEFLKFCGVMFIIIGVCGSKSQIKAVFPALERAMFRIKDTFERYARTDETKKTLTKTEMQTLLVNEMIGDESNLTEEQSKEMMKAIDAYIDCMDLNSDKKLDISEFLACSGDMLLKLIKLRGGCSCETMRSLEKTLLLLKQTFEKYAQQDGTKETLSKPELKSLLEKEFFGATQAEMADSSVDELIDKVLPDEGANMSFSNFLRFVSSLFVVVSVCERQLQSL